jgi:hypothetical protein
MPILTNETSNILVDLQIPFLRRLRIFPAIPHNRVKEIIERYDFRNIMLSANTLIDLPYGNIGFQTNDSELDYYMGTILSPNGTGFRFQIDETLSRTPVKKRLEIPVKYSEVRGIIIPEKGRGGITRRFLQYIVDSP